MTVPQERSAGEWLSEGLARSNTGEWDKAEYALENTVSLEPDNAEAWYRLGNARQEQHRHADAATCFERAVAFEPARAKAWNNLGVSREEAGNTAGAIAAYRQALQAEQDLLPALLNLSQLHMRGEDFTSAAPLLERATALDPSNPEPWENLGISLAKLNQPAQADAALRTAAGCRNTLARPFLEKAEAALARGERPEIEAALAAALNVLPGNPALHHMLTASRGETSSAPPEGYVAMLFDGFAAKYDEKMTTLLEYQVPGALSAAVLPDLQRAPRARVVDLGCGTGLLGSALAETNAEIIGIDLSAQMLERAAQRGVYSLLTQGDLVAELRKLPVASMRAVLAADVFVYLGDLQLAFAAAARALEPNGVFAFSVEALDQGEFQINIGGRYAHSPAYLRKLAADCGLLERSMEKIRPRREGEHYVEGWLACFTARAGTTES